MNIFSHESYVSLIEAAVEARKKTEPSFSFQRLATIANIQKSYLSKVLHGRAHLNSDQLYSIADYLGWKVEEQSFANLLLEHSRSGLATRRKKIGEQIAAIREAKLQTSHHIEAGAVSLSADATMELYLRPWLQLVHVALAIPRLRASLPKLGECFGLELEAVTQAVERLTQIGMAEWKDKKIVQKNPHLHLGKDSPYYQAWRNQMRMICLQRLHSHEQDDDYSFSVTFTADPTTRNWLQQEFLALLSRAETRVKNAADQEVYQMNFDLFRWTKK
ncbi:MAG: TIGR02147 family protein [Bacteriovoracia bacterium]